MLVLAHPCSGSRDRTAAVTVGAEADLQAALDAAPPGAVVRVTAGAHGSARLRRAVTLFANREAALRSQYAMLGLMVLYTVGGLWLLSRG